MRKSQLHKSLLIVRLSSMGDVVMASPMAEILKRENPNARIVWAVQQESAEILRGNPHIDKVLIWNKDRWRDLWRQKKLLTLWREINELKEDLRKENFETAYDLQGLFKSGFFTWLSGAKERIGIGSREGSYWFMHKMISRNIANRDRFGSEYRYLIAQLGYDDSQWDINIPITAQTDTTTEALLNRELQGDTNYAVICPFTTRASKEWPEEKWQQLVLRIRGRYRLKTIVLGAKIEGTLGQQLARKCGAINLAGRTNLTQAASILKKAKIVIGVDNGLTHISQALDTPSIALFGPSRPYIYADKNNSKVLYLDRFCSPCTRKPICGGSYDCMTDISSDMVLAEIKRLLRDAEEQITLKQA